MNHSSAEHPRSKFRVSRSSLLRKRQDSEGPLRVNLVFVAGGKAPRRVAVSAYPTVPSPGKGYKNLSDDEVCDRLRRWGFAIDQQMQVPPTDLTVNASNPIPMAGGLSDLEELLDNAVP